MVKTRKGHSYADLVMWEMGVFALGVNRRFDLANDNALELSCDVLTQSIIHVTTQEMILWL